jgi:hypothetical protein
VTDPLEKPEGLSWDAAAVELPEVPLLPPGEDAMSTTIAGVLPTLTAPLATSVAALQAKEHMFSGKLVTAESAYQNADDSGQQSIGQLAGMLGQVGQMGQQAGAPAQAASGLGGQTGMFGSLMQQAMQGASGGAGGQSSGGRAAAGQGGVAGIAGQGSGPASGQVQQPRDDATGAQQEHAEPEPRHDERETLQRAETDDRAMAGSSADDRSHAGRAPVSPPEGPRHGDGHDHVARRM